MARSRNIKPGFFTNDELGELEPLARLLFAGIWTLCDRAGRVEDRPKKIKAEVLPYDDCDADVLLEQLQAKGFIQRYCVDGSRLIQVVKWDKHQTPHMKEAASSLPAPVEHQTSTVLAPDDALPQPALAHLIPDSLSLDSLNLDSKEKKAPAAPLLVSLEELIADGLSEEVATAFLAHRKARKARLTPIAWKAFTDEVLKAGWSLEAAVLKAIARNWTTFEAAWVAEDRKGGGDGETPRQRSAREEAQRWAPSVARRAPGALTELEVFDVTAKRLG